MGVNFGAFIVVINCVACVTLTDRVGGSSFTAKVIAMIASGIQSGGATYSYVGLHGKCNGGFMVLGIDKDKERLLDQP